MKKIILAGVAACSLLLIQRCDKIESMTGTKGLTNTSPKRAANDVYITGTVPTGTYKITTGTTINAANKTMGVDSSLALAAPVQQLDYAINTGSDWRITDLGNGYYSIINTYSGQALTLGDTSLPEHEQIIQFNYGGVDAQQWKIAYQAFGAYRIESKLNVLKGVHVDPSSTGSGTPVKLETYPTSDPNAGYFYLSPVAVTYQDQAATDFFRRTSGWINSDGAATVLLNNGEILWLMGDSNIGQYDPNTGTVPCLAVSVRNSGLLQPSVTDWDWHHTLTLLGDNYPGRNSYIKQYPSDDTRWIWPGCGFQLPSNDTVYVICTPLKNGSGGGWADDGNKVFAKILSSTAKVVGFKTLQDFNGINFGIGVIKGTDGYIYVYGEKQTFIASDIFVARFPMSNPNADWTFWNGTGWDALATNAAAIGQGESTATNVVKINNKYILISTQFSMGCGTASHSMYASTSSSATGPFTNEHVIYNIPERYQGHTPFWYAPNAHPEFNTASNELLVTYDLNGYCGADCINGRTNPDYYRPKAIRVPFSVIDPSL